MLAAPRIPTTGIVGVLHASNPLDACSPLTNVSRQGQTLFSDFLLVERGVCNFEVKVWNAQEAGFEAVIIYNNQNDHELVTSTSAFSDVFTLGVGHDQIIQSRDFYIFFCRFHNRLFSSFVKFFVGSVLPWVYALLSFVI